MVLLTFVMSVLVVNQRAHCKSTVGNVSVWNATNHNNQRTHAESSRVAMARQTDESIQVF